MISLLQKKSLKFFHPVLKRAAKLYLSRPRSYTLEGIKVKVIPGVFHPGLFFSTGIFIAFLKTLDLQDKTVLELGAGSGLISFYCQKHGAHTTASDINPIALEALQNNALANQLPIKVIGSDLFDKLCPSAFDIILINPPYYPKKPASMEERAWFCGEGFEYFHKLFKQLNENDIGQKDVYMILSEDCDLKSIFSIAAAHNLLADIVHTAIVQSEHNMIYRIRQEKP